MISSTELAAVGTSFFAIHCLVEVKWHQLKFSSDSFSIPEVMPMVEIVMCLCPNPKPRHVLKFTIESSHRNLP